jgi:uncharacterized sulfatase
MKPQPLNFLLITSDQQRWDCLGKLNPLVPTPNLDRLADDGLLFTDAYCPSATCTPSRASLLTSQLPSRHGAYNIGTTLDPAARGISHWFGEHGYDTALIGKAHFQPCHNLPSSLESEPRVFDWEYFRNWTGPYYGFQHAELCIGHTTEKKAGGMHFGLWLRDQGVDLAKYFNYGQFDPFFGHGRWELPEAFHNSKWIADRSIDYIRRRTEAGRPFLLWASFQDPHAPCWVPAPWDTRVNPDAIPLPRVFPRDAEGKPPFYAPCKGDGGYLDPDYDADRSTSWNHTFGIPHSVFDVFTEPRTVRHVTALYYGMIALMDHHIGRMIDHLQRTGIYDRTVIVFASDHGDYLGHHRLWNKGLHAYDDIQKVPFIARVPGCRGRGRTSTALQNLMDIAPTFGSLAGLPPNRAFEGVDQTRVWTGEADAAQDWTLCEYRPNDMDFMQRTLVTDEYKLVVYMKKEYGELYHRRSDPNQQNNLWDKPEAQTIKGRLLLKLASADMERERTRQPRVAGA